ncbi:MAG TPA: hypothetical protein VJC20_03155 [Candidatus Paceibacterota bacterium]
MTSMPVQVSPTNKSHVGFVVGIIVALLVLAGILYYARQARQLAPAPLSDIQALEEQGTSDEITAIEQDLAKTDLGNLDQELSDIERELGAVSQ